MADNIAVTAGSGTTVKTDQLSGGEHVQYVKIMNGTADAEDVIQGDATNGLEVDVTRVNGTVSVDLGANNDVTVTSGTVTANLGATDNAVLDSIATNTGASLTDTELRATPVPASGSLTVDLGANNDVTLATLPDTVAGDLAAITTATEATQAAVEGTVTVDGTVTANLGATDNAVLDAIAADGDAIQTVLGTIDADTGAIKTAVETIDNAISGSEMQVDVVGALPAGTNAIGKLAANSGVDIGDVDVTSLPALAAGTNTIGKVAPNEYELAGNTTHVKKYYTNAGAVTDGVVWSPAAGKRWYITDIFINVSAAATVTLEDDLAAGDSVVWKAELAANSGWSHSFNTPLYSGEDAADLLVTTSAGNVYITVVGYEV